MKTNSRMKKYGALIVFCSCSYIGLIAQASDANPPLRMGLLPFLSTARLLDEFTPIKTYLESRLHRPVNLQTAPSFQTYIERAGTYQYDIYMTAPHIAAFVEQEYHYRRLARLTRELDGSIVVLKNGQIKSLAELKNRVFATPADIAIITMLGEEFLMEHHLYNGTNITIQYTPSHNNAVIAVATGKADAAISSTAVLESMSPQIREKLTVLAKTVTVPQIMFMASPKLAGKDYQLLRRAMLEFTATGPGRDFFNTTGYENMGEIRDQDMQRLRPYVKLLQQRLNKHD